MSVLITIVIIILVCFIPFYAKIINPEFKEEKSTIGETKIISEKDLEGKRIIKIWEHESWGNSVSWNKYEDRRIYGFLYHLPDEGDVIMSKMVSGKIGCFKISSVRHCNDPSDMFFATVSDWGYLSDDIKI